VGRLLVLLLALALLLLAAAGPLRWCPILRRQCSLLPSLFDHLDVFCWSRHLDNGRHCRSPLVGVFAEELSVQGVEPVQVDARAGLERQGLPNGGSHGLVWFQHEFRG
jgi:hypothetical protein